MHNELPFDIGDIANMLGLEVVKNKKTSLDVVCPFCGDKRGKMNLCIVKDGSRKDLYSCKNCGVGGNMLKLYAELKGINFYDSERRKEMIKEIINNLGLTQNINYVPKQKTKPEPETKKVSDAYLNKVYRAFLNECKLLPRHQKNLNKRGLNKNQINKYLLKSVPYNGIRICKILIGSGLKLEGVPGFFINDDGVWDIFNVRGFFCPVFNTKGEIIALQIRADVVKNGRKYIWFSSVGKKMGTSVKSCSTFLGDINATEIIITEGILKAIICYEKTGVTIIGMPGISDRNSIHAHLDKLKNVNLVHEAFDMDKRLYPVCKNDYKCNKCQGLTKGGFCINKKQKIDTICIEQKKLIQALKERNLVVKSMYWDYTIIGSKKIWQENYKGLDDFLYGKELKNGNKSLLSG